MSASRNAPDATQVSWLEIPIVGLPEMACVVPVNVDGHALDAAGEPLPMEDRPNPCGKDGRWMLGECFLCQDHAREVAALGGDDIDAIEAAWKAQL